MKHPKLYHLPSKVSNDPMEDKLTLFRQQAAIIARKKESTAEKLNDVRVELAAIEDEVKEKKSGELLNLCLNSDFLQFYHPILNT